MLLKMILTLKQTIDQRRQDLNSLTENKSFLDPEVIRLSQMLDQNIVEMQRILMRLRKQ